MTTTAAPEDLASYVPSLILQRTAAAQGAALAPGVERFPAAVLFADLSGFTALTEYLTQHSPAGAEDLTSILDLYFGHLVGVVMSHGGDVVKFAGDGLLALWYGDEPLSALAQRAVQCALAVQMMMAPEAWGSIDGAAPPPALKVRVGVGAGQVTTMQLGGIFGRWELLVTGDPLTEAGRAESEARPGEVLIAAGAWPLVAHACVGGALASGNVRLDALADQLPMRRLVPPPLGPELATPLRAYLPKAILARLDAGQTAWLAEQRRVTVLFVNLPTLGADTPLRQAQALMRALQSSLYRYEGSITRLGTDAKGPTLVAALGLPPLAHEDDAERGVRAALAIHQALRELGFPCAIGVTTGRALCGAVGAPHRREYTMMGSIVNRSARLMQAAGSGAVAGGLPILCDEATYRAARAHLHFEPIPPMQIKGVAAPVAIYKALPAIEHAPDQPALRDQAGLVGRAREQQLIAERVAQLAADGSSAALLVEGEAGVGKSTMLAYSRDLARDSGLLVASGSGSPVESPPYHAWRPVVVELLMRGAELIGAQAEPVLARQAALALEALGAADLAPLLGAVLGLDLPETPLTALMSGQLRADNTRELLLRLLALCAARSRVVAVFDDAHWLDPGSWLLIQEAAEQVAGLLLLVAARPLAEPPAAYQRLAYNQSTVRLQLRGLAAPALGELLTRRLGVESVPDPVLQLIAARSQGNPFVAEELLHTLQERGTLVVEGRSCRLAAGAGPTQALGGAALPDTVEGLITSRIDRLTAAQQLTLKVASVIGPSFALAALAALHPVERDRERLVEQLFALQQLGLVVIESFEPDLVYAFKHAVGAEAAYNLMSYGQRRVLHRTLAEQYEAVGAQGGVAAAQLAQHWRQAGEPLRALRYLALAGEEALRGGAYGEAIALLGEALAITRRSEPSSLAAAGADERSLARWQRQLGEANHGLGRLSESRALLETAVARLGQPVPRAPLQLIGALAGESLRQARSLVRPGARGEPGPGPHDDLARAYTLLARLAYYDGEFAAAAHAALRGLNLAERGAPAPELAWSYAAVQLAASPVPPLAQLYRRRARAAADRLGHLPTHGWLAEAHGLYELGHGRWRRAEAALDLALAVGDRLGDQRRRAEAIAARCVAACYQGQFRRALVGCEELQTLGLRSGDRQVQAWGLIGAAENLLALGESAAAQELLGDAEALLDGARAEQLWLLALRARAALLRGDNPQAQRSADAAAAFIGPLPPLAVYTLGGHAALAEVRLALLAQHAPGDGRGIRQRRAAVRRACASLSRFALMFPVARPAALTWGGLRHWQAGRRGLAQHQWRHAINLAQRLGMPYDEARARAQLGHHTPDDEGRRQLHEAAAIFARLGCRDALADAYRS